MPFTPTELDLLWQGCYGAPDLAAWLEHMRDEGPGEDWSRTRPSGPFTPDELPLHERVWAQLWHQGTIYPASYVAVPVLVEVVARFPTAGTPLVEQVALIEESRTLWRQTNSPDLATLPEAVRWKYHAALVRLADLIPGLLRAHAGGDAQDDFARTRALLAGLAVVSGRPLLGRLVADFQLLEVNGEVNPILLNFEERTGDHTLSRRLRGAAEHRRSGDSGDGAL